MAAAKVPNVIPKLPNSGRSATTNHDTACMESLQGSSGARPHSCCAHDRAQVLKYFEIKPVLRDFNTGTGGRKNRPFLSTFEDLNLIY
jgi:hypothetical protein